MNVASVAASDDSDVATYVRWDVVERRCRELGATSDPQRGRLLGVSRMTVMRWRHGTHGISLSVARRVADVLGVQMDQLLSGTPKPGTPPPSPPPPQPPRPGGPPGRSGQ